MKALAPILALGVAGTAQAEADGTAFDALARLWTTPRDVVQQAILKVLDEACHAPKHGERIYVQTIALSVGYRLRPGLKPTIDWPMEDAMVYDYGLQSRVWLELMELGRAGKLAFADKGREAVKLECAG